MKDQKQAFKELLKQKQNHSTAPKSAEKVKQTLPPSHSQTSYRNRGNR